MTLDVKVDTSHFDRAILRFAAGSKKTSYEILRNQARLFVRDVARITPPFRGYDKGGRELGEKTVRTDIRRVVSTLTPAQMANSAAEWTGDFAHAGASKVGSFQYKIIRSIDELAAWHKAHRNKKGRVPKINFRATTGIRKTDLKYGDKAYVTPQMQEKYIKLTQKRVGLLASGWNAAAQKLGASLPAWITRHGTSRGQCDVTTSSTIKIKITNSVKFSGDVKGIDRRVQWALNNRARQMNKQVDDFAVKKAARAAGFKVA